LTEYFAGFGVERRVQRQSAVSEVLKAVSLGAAWGERQHRIFAVERLDRCFLIDTEHRGMRRWVQIQPNDVRRLGLEVRVVGGHVAVEPLRLQTVLGPDPRYHHVADSKLGPELACAPLSRAVWGFALERPLQDA